MSSEPNGITRRTALRQTAVAAGLVWTVPTIRSSRLLAATGTPPPGSSTSPTTIPGPDYFAVWPSKEETLLLAERLQFMGPIEHGNFALLVGRHVYGVRCGTRPGVPDEFLGGPDDYLRLIYESWRGDLAEYENGWWHLTPHGESLARLFTAEGPPPGGLELGDLSAFLEDDRENIAGPGVGKSCQ